MLSWCNILVQSPAASRISSLAALGKPELAFRETCYPRDAPEEPGQPEIFVG